MHYNIIHLTVVHQRFDIRIFYKQCVSLKNSFSANVKLLVADGKGDEINFGIPIIDLGAFKHSRIQRAVLSSFKAYRKLKKIDYNILHIHDPELLPLGIILKLKGKIVIYDMHENLPKEILTKHYLNRFLRFPLSFFLKIFQNLSFNLLPVVFAENSYEKDFPNVKKSVIVLNYPIISELIKVHTEKKKIFSLAYLGGVSKERGGLMLLEVIKELRNEGLAIEAKIVGPCSDDVINTDIYKESTSSGWVSFSGRVKPEIAWKLISECHVGIAILQPSPNFVDSYPTKLFEYLILGMPCIVSNFPLYKLIVEDANCGLTVNPENVNDIKKAVSWMYFNQSEAQKMGVRGKTQAIQKYNWDSEFFKLSKFYTDLV